MMKRIFFTSLFITLTSSVFSQTWDENKIIKLIYPNYFTEILDSGWVSYFEEEQPVTISSVQLYPLDTDSSRIIIEIDWRSDNYTMGDITEFFILMQKDSLYQVVAKTVNNDDRLFYGGGTQRYDDPKVIDSQITLSDSSFGFVIGLNSYHFASQTTDNEFFLYAIINQEIKKVFSSSLSHGFLSFSLKEMVDDKSSIEEFYQNINDYIPNEFYQEDISEVETKYEILNSQTMGMNDILLTKTLYSLVEKKIIIEVKQRIFQWNGDEYIIQAGNGHIEK